MKKIYTSTKPVTITVSNQSLNMKPELQTLHQIPKIKLGQIGCNYCLLILCRIVTATNAILFGQMAAMSVY